MVNHSGRPERGQNTNMGSGQQFSPSFWKRFVFFAAILAVGGLESIPFSWVRPRIFSLLYDSAASGLAWLYVLIGAAVTWGCGALLFYPKIFRSMDLRLRFFLAVCIMSAGLYWGLTALDQITHPIVPLRLAP